MCVLLSPREQCTHNTCADCDKKLSYFIRRFPSPFELIFPSTDIGHEYPSRPSAKRNPSRMIFARFSCIMCIMDACDLTENPFALKNENSDSTRRVSGQHVSRVETTTKSKIPEEKKKTERRLVARVPTTGKHPLVQQADKILSLLARVADRILALFSVQFFRHDQKSTNRRYPAHRGVP